MLELLQLWRTSLYPSIRFRDQESLYNAAIVNAAKVRLKYPFPPHALAEQTARRVRAEAVIHQEILLGDMPIGSQAIQADIWYRHCADQVLTSSLSISGTGTESVARFITDLGHEPTLEEIAEIHADQLRRAMMLRNNPTGFSIIDEELALVKRLGIPAQPPFDTIIAELIELGAQRYKNLYETAKPLLDNPDNWTTISPAQG